MAKPVHLPGTTLEGGGQLLRIACGLSALTAIPLHITDIRGNRSGGGGLKLQHLTGVQWLSRACGAPISGAEKKSRTLQFWLQDGNRNAIFKRISNTKRIDNTIDIGSPGAIGLVFQAILPYILFSGCAEEEFFVTIKGGTNVSNSLSIDYIQQVLIPMLSIIGLPNLSARIHHRGWSTGHNVIGAVTFTIRPLAIGTCLPAFSVKGRGSIVRISATILAPKTAEKHAYREITRAVNIAFPDVDLDLRFEDSQHPKRVYLLLVSTTARGYKLGRDWLYDRKITSIDEIVPKLVERVVTDLAAEVGHAGSCVDEYMRDQLAIFQALAKGRSVVDGGMTDEDKLVEPSLHAKTAWWVGKEILGVEFETDGSCEGVGFVVGEKFERRKESGTIGGEIELLVEDIEKGVKKLRFQGEQ
jgi:RNA 3'-terminal phosphate cyclase (ATP)